MNTALIQIVLGVLLIFGGVVGLSRREFAIGLGGHGARLGTPFAIRLSPPVAITANLLIVIGGVIELIGIFIPDLRLTGLAVAILGSMLVGLLLQVAYSLHRRLVSEKK